MDCPTCHDANADRDYQGPTCNDCDGRGFVGTMGQQEMFERALRLAEKFPHEIEQWLEQRANNAVCIGNQKTDKKDQAGWYEDAMYFVAAQALIKNALIGH